MKKFTRNLIFASTSLCAVSVGFNAKVFAHGTLYGHSHITSQGTLSNDANAPYIHITPDTANSDSTIQADFMRNPNISSTCGTPSFSTCNVDSLNIVASRFLAKGFNGAGLEIFSGTTTTTFANSQGVYQDVVNSYQTGGSFDLFEFIIPPEATTAFHSHTQGTEIFYVIGGDPDNENNPNVPDNNDVIFELNTDVDGIFNLADPFNPFSVVKDSEIEINGVEVTKGSFVALPGGKIHTWSNTGDIPARLIALITPSGIAQGFENLNAPAGIFDPAPTPHPLTNNCVATTGTQVDCLIPEDQDYYNLLLQLQIFPDLPQQLGFNPIPLTLPGATCPVVYGVNTGGGSAFQILPTSTQGDTNCPDPSDAVSATTDPFTGSSYDNPFVLLGKEQNNGILNPSPIGSNVFSIASGESFNDLISDSHESFRILEGDVNFNFNGLNQMASAGDYIFVEAGNIFGIEGISGTSNLIRFSATPISANSVPESKSILGLAFVGLFLFIGKKRK